VEVFFKLPAKRTFVMHLPGGDSVTAFDGQAGWLGTPGHPVREMTNTDLDGARMDADLYLPLHLRQIFSDLSAERAEMLENHLTYLVSGRREGLPPVKLYFDQQSGLLVRVLRFVDSPLGLNPTQIDYTDYREAGGVKTPFRWTISRPGGRFFTIQVDRTQENVPVDDAKFAKPPAPEPNTPPH
jgi:photosynthetic reaction center cytochrome c subunit